MVLATIYCLLGTGLRYSYCSNFTKSCKLCNKSHESRIWRDFPVMNGLKLLVKGGWEI